MPRLMVKPPVTQAAERAEYVVAAQEVGLKLRQLRRAAGLSLRQIGEAIGVSFVQVQRYESGASPLSIIRLLCICGVLDVPVTSLLSHTIVIGEDQRDSRQRESRELARLFAALSDPADRRAILHLARTAVAQAQLFVPEDEPARTVAGGQMPILNGVSQ